MLQVKSSDCGDYMYKNYIVRADFYPTGRIIPLGFTDSFGETLYVKKIISINYKSSGEEIIRCIIKNKKHTVIFKNNKWEIYSD